MKGFPMRGKDSYKQQNAGNGWEKSQNVGILGKLVPEDGRPGSPGPRKQTKQPRPQGSGEGSGIEEGGFSSRKPAFSNIQREVRMGPDTGGVQLARSAWETLHKRNHTGPGALRAHPVPLGF